MPDFEPPRPLSIAARKTYDRHIARIHSEGRYQQIDHDQLATYAETLELYSQCKAAIDEHGVLVPGRTQHELVRNPASTPLNQARDALIRLARSVPLVNPVFDQDGIGIDHLLEELRS